MLKGDGILIRKQVRPVLRSSRDVFRGGTAVPPRLFSEYAPAIIQGRIQRGAAVPPSLISEYAPALIHIRRKRVEDVVYL